MNIKLGFFLCFLFYGYCRAAVDKCVITIEATEGPYYKSGSPQRLNSTICECDDYDNATQLLVHGQVLESDCKTGVVASLDIWSADAEGVYSPLVGPDFTCRGKILTDEKGHFEYFTILPGAYEQFGRMRPQHIHYKITRGHNNETDTTAFNRTLTTQQYFENDPYFKTDPCEEECHAGDPTLTVPLQTVMGNDKSYMIKFNIVLDEKHH